MNGLDICTVKFTEPFDLDICGADCILDARQTFECYGKHTAVSGNVVFRIDAPNITVSAAKTVEYFGLRDVFVEYANVYCLPNSTWYGCTACNEKCGSCKYDNKDTCLSCNAFQYRDLSVNVCNCKTNYYADTDPKKLIC